MIHPWSNKLPSMSSRAALRSASVQVSFPVHATSFRITWFRVRIRVRVRVSAGVRVRARVRLRVRVSPNPNPNQLSYHRAEG